MNVEIICNEWCPENCPYIDLQTVRDWRGSKIVCSRRDICFGAVLAYKEFMKKREDEVNE